MPFHFRLSGKASISDYNLDPTKERERINRQKKKRKTERGEIASQKTKKKIIKENNNNKI